MTTKSDLAYEHLRDAIISGAIKPDVPLRISALGKETGYGSTPVREALRRLESENLVVSAVNCGFRSAPVSVNEIKDLESSRLVIETALLKDAILHGDDRWEGEIVAAFYRLSKLDVPVDMPDLLAQTNWGNIHQQFHESLVAASPSKWLHFFQKQINEQLLRKFQFTMDESLLKRVGENQDLKDALRQSLGIEHHKLLMDATLARDVPLAIALLEEHIQFAARFFSRCFSDQLR